MALQQSIRFDNLLSSVKGYLTPDMVQSASSMIGDSESATRQAMHSSVSAIFAGMANLASSAEGASTLGNLSREPAFGSILNNLSSVFSGGSATASLMSAGQGILGKIFGDRSEQASDAIAHTSGVSQTSAGKIMSLLAPLTIGVLGRQVVALGLSNSGLASMLIEQKDEIEASAPAGLAKILAIRRGPSLVGVRIAPDTEVYHAPVAITEPERPASRGRRLTWLLLLAAVVAFLWFFSEQGGREGQQAVQKKPATLSIVTLPGSVNLSVPEGSINYNVARFLADGNQTAPRTFLFDYLNFQTGSTQLTPESSATVNNLAQILKAYPKARVQLSGHTDNTGSLEANQKLSLDRADAVKQMLVSGGVAEDRISTAGYGQDRPIAANDTEDGRAKNRRIELTVIKK